MLELGCGTGRVLIPTARAGASITGLDLSELMLDVCRRKLAAELPDVRARAVLVHGDMTSFSRETKFALITVPFRAFQHLISVEQQLACLACVRDHLTEDGTLALDVFRPSIRLLVAGPEEEPVEDCPESPLPDGRTVRRTNRRTAVDLWNQQIQVEFEYYLKDTAGSIEHFRESFPMRYFFRYELEHLLARAGMRVIERYGGFDRSAMTGDSQAMILLARREETRALPRPRPLRDRPTPLH